VGGGRYSYGTSPTSYRYTGQRQESGIGLYYYGSRWYDAALGRFTSPDSIIPAQQGVMENDRYAYTNNNPVVYNDPSGHSVDDCPPGDTACEEIQDEEKDDTTLKSNDEAFPGDYDYVTLSLYFGQASRFLTLLLAQLEPTPFVEASSVVISRIVSPGVSSSWDRNG
jgi:RHS repeat-associated protein